MNNTELFERFQRKTDYLLGEVQKSEDSIKDHISDEIKKIDCRVTSLEHFRTYIHAATGAILALYAGLKAKLLE